LILHIDNLRTRANIATMDINWESLDIVHPEQELRIQDSSDEIEKVCYLNTSQEDPRDNTFKRCKEFLLKSEVKWKDFPRKSWKQRRKDLAAKQVKRSKQIVKNHKTQTEWIDTSVL
jgi:hypothetical protein